MKRKLMLIGGGLVFASSFPMIAASCDGKTKETEKENKDPVKKEDSKKVAEKENKDPVKKEDSKKVAEKENKDPVKKEDSKKVAEKENKDPVKKEDSKKVAEKENKDPVKKEDSKKVAEQPKLETTENDKIDKENKAGSMPAETTRNSESTASTNSITKRADTTEADLEGVRASSYIYDVWARDIYKYKPKTKDVKSSKSDLDAVKASNYIYDVWARDIYKYKPTEKTPVVKDPTKEQEEKAEKANALNLKDRNSYSPAKRKKDQETVSDWLKNFNNR